jgi:rubrerythrin
MNAIEFAKEIEQEGIAHYRSLAGRTQIKELNSIFNFLADEEQRHYEIFNSWEENPDIPPLEKSGVLTHAKETFAAMTEQFKSFGAPVVHRTEAYEKALAFENKSIELYTAALDTLGEEGQKSVLTSIIEQEKSHARLMQSLIDFQRHPGQWLEDAEWYHLDEF